MNVVARQPHIDAKTTYLHVTGEVGVGAMEGDQAREAQAEGKGELAMGEALAVLSICCLQHHTCGLDDTKEEMEFLECHFLDIGLDM